MQILEDPRYRWRGLITLAAIVTLCLGSAIALAAPAEAKTFYGSKPPSKSWICSVFNICHTGTWCVQGDPRIAYNKTTPPWRCYTVRY